MITLNSIYIDGLGPHKDLTVDLQPGINLIMGPNGSGKTILIESFPGATWGRFLSRSGSLFRFCTQNEGVIRINYNDNETIERHVKKSSQSGMIGSQKYSKITEFESRNHNIFGGLEDYQIAHHFSQKGNNDLVSYEPSKRKEFFRRILALEYFEPIAKNFRDKSFRGDMDIDVLEAEIIKIQDEMEKMGYDKLCPDATMYIEGMETWNEEKSYFDK